MWSLTSEDVRQAREYASRRRTEIEERYCEELRTLDAELAELDAMERLAGEFASKRLRAEGVASVEPEPASEPEGSAAALVEGRNGSRWRLHFGNPPGGEEPAQP